MSNNPKNITEADVIEFLCAKIASLSAATGETYCAVEIDVTNKNTDTDAPAFIECKAYTPSGAYTTAKTLEEAIAANIANCAPACRADRIREQAARLLTEAKRIEAVAREAATKEGA